MTNRVIGRCITGLLLIAVFAAILWLDWHLESSSFPGHGWARGPLVGLPLATLLLVLICVGYRELSRLMAAAQVPVCGIMTLICAVVIGVGPFWRQALRLEPAIAEAATGLVLAGAIMLLFAEQLIRYRTSGAIRRLAGSLLAVCYLGVCSAVVLSIRIHMGLRAFILFIVVIKGTDIGAYLVGTFLGRRRLVPWLSGGKTWEGLLGGMAAAAICGVALGAEFGKPIGPIGAGTMLWWRAALFGAVLGLIGQAADLCESALKRDAGAKDSGRAIPTYGGALDLVDSPLLAAPAAYLLLAALQ